MSNVPFSASLGKAAFVPPAYEEPHIYRQIEEILADVTRVVSKVWPLKDYVAFNPYNGIADRSFADARAFLRIFSDCEMLMPLPYYRSQYAQGRFTRADVRQAIAESQQDGVAAGWSIDAVMDRLRASTIDESPQSHAATRSERRPIRTIAELADQISPQGWGETITDEIGKFCAAHYDQFQSTWASPWKELPFYQAWRSAAQHDRNPEILGLTGFRRLVGRLPHTPTAALVELLSHLQIPSALWESFLLCQVFHMPGWCAWAKYQDDAEPEAQREHLIGLLAARTVYEVALADAKRLRVRWDAMVDEHSATFRATQRSDDDDTAVRLLLLRACEINHRDGILGQLIADERAEQNRKRVQMVFCIDVRSERIRRHLESLSPEIETYGFAGFFGMPIEYVKLGDHSGDHNVPALIQPSMRLQEGLTDGTGRSESEIKTARQRDGLWSNLWRGFQKSAVGCFSFVETTGLLYSVKLLADSATPKRRMEDKMTGDATQPSTGPTLRGLYQQGWTTSRQADLAEAMLRNLGLTDGFARLVVLCGHGSQTKNNPLAAGLDCGACGGHSGEPNARFAALLLNQAYVREMLAERGIEIDDDTVFLAALHNTTTDRIEYFDLDSIPASHRGDVEELIEQTRRAAENTRQERLPSAASPSPAELTGRAMDWSEVRPEWGLAGNAAFLVGPRELSRSINLDGRVFLHSYDHAADSDGAVLENIMTAPMVVAHWINMQYYASTVDNHHFGSGDKTIHNVVGGFGLLSGGGGDLMTGLPTQSIHDGTRYQHRPLRLQVIIAAPPAEIDRVLDKHPSIRELIDNQWIHLTAINHQKCFRYARADWCVIDADRVPAATD
ncbi:YbcC family protein [Stieleria mannarensis]|uniref:YbcC family protein n=1 Tax=Stieleria mannarensis TaxID=2755585 RepID=UPI0015FEBB78|nr:DUF2309 domain-containing protein [Rhodopirellula sp. JC639]